MSPQKKQSLRRSSKTKRPHGKLGVRRLSESNDSPGPGSEKADNLVQFERSDAPLTPQPSGVPSRSPGCTSKKDEMASSTSPLGKASLYLETGLHDIPLSTNSGEVNPGTTVCVDATQPDSARPAASQMNAETSQGPFDRAHATDFAQPRQELSVDQAFASFASSFAPTLSWLEKVQKVSDKAFSGIMEAADRVVSAGAVSSAVNGLSAITDIPDQIDRFIASFEAPISSPRAGALSGRGDPDLTCADPAHAPAAAIPQTTSALGPTAVSCVLEPGVTLQHSRSWSDFDVDEAEEAADQNHEDTGKPSCAKRLFDGCAIGVARHAADKPALGASRHDGMHSANVPCAATSRTLPRSPLRPVNSDSRTSCSQPADPLSQPASSPTKPVAANAATLATPTTSADGGTREVRGHAAGERSDALPPLAPSPAPSSVAGTPVKATDPAQVRKYKQKCITMQQRIAQFQASMTQLAAENRSLKARTAEHHPGAGPSGASALVDPLSEHLASQMQRLMVERSQLVQDKLALEKENGDLWELLHFARAEGGDEEDELCADEHLAPPITTA